MSRTIGTVDDNVFWANYGIKKDLTEINMKIKIYITHGHDFAYFSWEKLGSKRFSIFKLGYFSLYIIWKLMQIEKNNKCFSMKRSKKNIVRGSNVYYAWTIR